MEEFKYQKVKSEVSFFPLNVTVLLYVIPEYKTNIANFVLWYLGIYSNCELEDKDCIFERKLKPSEFIILWNTYPGTPGFFWHPVEKLVYWAPSCSPICDSSYFSAKQPSAAPHGLSALSLGTLTHWSERPRNLYQNSLLLEEQEKAKRDPGLRCWVSTLPAQQPKATLECATTAGPDAAASATENTQRARNSACCRAWFKTHLLPLPQQTLNGTSIHTEDRGTNFIPGNFSTVPSYKIVPSHNTHACKCFWPQHGHTLFSTSLYSLMLLSLAGLTASPTQTALAFFLPIQACSQENCP